MEVCRASIMNDELIVHFMSGSGIGDLPSSKGSSFIQAKLFQTSVELLVEFGSELWKYG